MSTATLIIILRVIHIFAGVFWAGSAFMMVSYVEPSVLASGTIGQQFMRQLGMKSTYSVAMAVTATLTAISGLFLYDLVFDLSGGILSTSRGLVITIGALAGLAAWITGFAIQFRTISKMKKITIEIEASEGPPSPDQMATMQALGERVSLGGRITAVLLVIALIGMSTAEYLT
jgi:uncharacterized membrane protein